MDGNVIAIIGAVIAVILPGLGSAIGTSWVQQAVAGVISEEPDKFGKTFILQLIPSSNALYGFVVGFLVLFMKVEFGAATLSVSEGLTVLFTCMPIAIVGLVACIMQAKVCAAGVHMVGKRVELSSRAVPMAIIIELFALFALIVSILGVLLM